LAARCVLLIHAPANSSAPMPWGVSGRCRPADVSLRAAALPGRGDAGAGSGGDSRGRRPCHPRRHVTDPCLDDRKPCAGPGRAGGRTRPYGPLIHPTDAPPKAGYTPSQALADFVRCRDLTCRFPGCDKPAACCHLDHTIPYRDGGRTHASNLKCLCRLQVQQRPIRQHERQSADDRP
jgi:hypothetical protein